MHHCKWTLVCGMGLLLLLSGCSRATDSGNRAEAKRSLSLGKLPELPARLALRTRELTHRKIGRSGRLSWQANPK
jgi:hypothetical protein